MTGRSGLDASAPFTGTPRPIPELTSLPMGAVDAFPPQRLQTKCGSNHASVTVSGNSSTLRMRVAVQALQNTSKERASFALISPRVVIAPLPDLRERFI